MSKQNRSFPGDARSAFTGSGIRVYNRAVIRESPTGTAFSLPVRSSAQKTGKTSAASAPPRWDLVEHGSDMSQPLDALYTGLPEPKHVWITSPESRDLGAGYDASAVWDDFVAAHPNGHILQTARWAQLKSAFGWTAQRAELRTIPSPDAPILGGASILYRRLPWGQKVAYVPKGPVVDWAAPDQARAVLTMARAFGKKAHAALLKIEPELPDTPEVSARMASYGFVRSPPARPAAQHHPHRSRRGRGNDPFPDEAQVALQRPPGRAQRRIGARGSRRRPARDPEADGCHRRAGRLRRAQRGYHRATALFALRPHVDRPSAGRADDLAARRGTRARYWRRSPSSPWARALGTCGAPRARAGAT